MSLTAYAEQIQKLKHQYVIALAEARQAQNPDMTPEGLQNHRDTLVARVRAQYLPKLAALETDVRRDAEILFDAADEAIPAAQGSTRDAWQRVEMLLAAGKALPDIITAADVPQLQAIREWAPSWLAANRHKAKGANIGAGTTTALENSIRDRWAEILPNGGTLREALEAKQVAAGLEYTISNLRTELEGKPTGRNTLAVAFGATQAADEAGQRLQVKAEGTADYSQASA
jgi:hypothetical protein